MFAVSFYASCFINRGNLIGKKLVRLDWEKAVYRLLFTLASTLDCETHPVHISLLGHNSDVCINLF